VLQLRDQFRFRGAMGPPPAGPGSTSSRSPFVSGWGTSSDFRNSQGFLWGNMAVGACGALVAGTILAPVAKTKWVQELAWVPLCHGWQGFYTARSVQVFKAFPRTSGGSVCGNSSNSSNSPGSRCGNCWCWSLHLVLMAAAVTVVIAVCCGVTRCC
jgi:hypothetical protein